MPGRPKSDWSAGSGWSLTGGALRSKADPLPANAADIGQLQQAGPPCRLKAPLLCFNSKSVQLVVENGDHPYAYSYAVQPAWCLYTKW